MATKDGKNYTFEGSEITACWSNYNEHLCIYAINPEPSEESVMGGFIDDRIEYHIEWEQLKKILKEFDFTAEKKKTRVWVTGWKRRPKKQK